MLKLHRTVIALGVVSFFTDVSSEMIYPLLPLFLSSMLGAGAVAAVALGIIEGVAESTAAILKIISGYWTDKLSKRKPFLMAGYGLAGLARPLIGLAGIWPVVLGLRFLDRVGKGLRTSPRDALIADVTTPDRRGAAYGFHRSLDHAGAVVGPLVAAALLTISGVTLRTVFLLAFIPAVIVMLILFFGVKENPSDKPAVVSSSPVRLSLRDVTPNFRWFLLALLIFTLGNSTDAFMLLRLTQADVPAGWIAVLWSLHHVVKMTATYKGGLWADRFGHRRLIMLGWAFYAAVYTAFAWVDSATGMIVVFLIYGVYYGLTEPAEKALVSLLTSAERKGTGFGLYHGAIGLGALPASLIFGLVWRQAGASAAFIMGAGLAAMAAIVLTQVKVNR
ncbi:MAG: MFS transporter [Calditrichota bacterium]